jgi:hypothetical protein
MMSELVTFRANHVGIIEPWSPELCGVHGNGAYWQCYFTRPERPRQARSIAEARVNMLLRIAEWFDSCGGSFSEIRDRLLLQAETEKEGVARQIRRVQ